MPENTINTESEQMSTPNLGVYNIFTLLINVHFEQGWKGMVQWLGG